MADRTVEFYENKMEEAIKESITKNASLFSRINIPPEKLRSATSFSDLSEQCGIPVEILNGFIVFAIAHLMHEYYFNGTGIPPRSIFDRMFASNDNVHDQREIAHQVILACDQAQLSGLTHRPIQECINDIKTHLETGLLANNIHPQDNFPKIVKAIANQTAGMEEWEFSPNAIERLNQIETANRLER